MLSLTRIWLPIAIGIAGAALIALGRGRTTLAGIGVGLVIVGIIVWMVNWMFRMSLESNRDRDQEERAREYFDEHGRWPGE